MADRGRKSAGDRGLERLDELARGGEPVGRLLGEADREHKIDLGRELGREIARAARRRVSEAVQQIGEIGGGERRVADIERGSWPPPWIGRYSQLPEAGTKLA